MKREYQLIRDSIDMLLVRKQSKKKVKELINNPRVKCQEIYFNIMDNADNFFKKDFMGDDNDY
jgi:hypothetical protein